jgi:PAS domain S-box-containing protein
LLATGSTRNFETSIQDKYGTIRYVTAAQELITFDDEACILTSLEDITELKEAEKLLQRTNRTLRAHSASNQAMLRANNEAELLNEVCKIVVEDCGHAMVWIGYAENDEEKLVRPVAYAGFEEGYLETLKITWKDTERGRGPTGTAIRTRKPQSCRNMLTDPQFAPWREQALERGYASSLVLPLVTKDSVLGAMTIYSREPDAFAPDDTNLLNGLALDLSQGIEMIRLREAHELATAALRESEERFRLALSHAPVTVAVQDRGLHYTWAYNQRTRNLDEIIGKTDADLFPDEAEHLTALKLRVFETGENASDQLWVNSNDRRLFLDLFIEPLKNMEGDIDSIGIATVDLTAIKLAEEALRESEAKYRNLFENMTEEVQFWQLVRDDAGCIKTWRLVDANPPTLKTWGWDTINEIQGKTTEEIFGPGATDHYMPIVQKIMTEGVPYFYEDYFPNLEKYFRFTSVPLGEYFITTGADITISKKAEQALRVAHDELEIRVRERTAELAAANIELSKEIAERREIERQLRIQTAAMEAAGNGIIITNPKGIMLWTNPAMTQISGYSREDLIGHSTRLFNSGKNEPDFYHQMWGTIIAGNVWRGETTNRRKDGTLYIEEQTITPVQNDAGELSHFIAIKQDVTERKLMYAQLEASNRELLTLSNSERQQRFLAEGLVESSAVLNMSLELHAVLDRIFEQTRRIIPFLTADIVLIDGEIATIVRQWWADAYADERTIVENDSLKIQEFPIWEKVCSTKTAVMVSDTGDENQWSSYIGMKWIRSYLGAPLIYNDQIIGIINLMSDQANAFREDMVKTLKAFAAPAAVAIQNARLYETEQQNRKVAEILSAASVALAQTLDIQMVMETILDYMQFIMPLDVAFVVLSEGDEMYRIRAARTGNNDDALRNTLLDQTIDMLSEPIVRSYFAKYESTFIPDSREIPSWNPPLELAAMHCWLGIPLESLGKILGIVVLSHATPNIFDRNQIRLAEAVVRQAVVALQNAWLFEQVRSGRERLQQLSRHLVEVQENERKYIARELHDETSQSLTSLKMGLQVIENEAERRVRLTEQVRNLQALADETLESLHHLAVNLRPASLDHLGLTDALTSLIESTKQRSGLQAHFKIIGSMESAILTDEIETSIYRIVQESITNVLRHANATYVDVILEWQDEKILIVIEDDGAGMDIQKARETGRLGLVGMQERAEMLGGRLLIDSTPQVGTTLVVEIPYANSNPYSR